MTTAERQKQMASDDVAGIDELGIVFQRLRTELAKIIVGQDDVIERLAICLFARGHALLMGVPGLAKTLLVSRLAETMSLHFSRIQFTPDLMPMDITGTDILQDSAGGRREFEFVKGPVFANIVLADEINRAPAKTQAAMLEAMQEHRVTVVGKTFHLEQPFFVLATQNPVEQEGTYPLPEAQLDRFMFLIEVDYPNRRGNSDRADDHRCGIAEARSDFVGTRRDSFSRSGAACSGPRSHLRIRCRLNAPFPSRFRRITRLAQAVCRLGRRSACRSISRPRCQGPRGTAWQLHGAIGRYPGSRRAGADSSCTDHFRCRVRRDAQP